MRKLEPNKTRFLVEEMEIFQFGGGLFWALKIQNIRSCRCKIDFVCFVCFEKKSKTYEISSEPKFQQKSITRCKNLVP